MKVMEKNSPEKGKLEKGGGEGNGNPLQNSCLANPMDGGAWWAAVHALEKEMATHSSVLAWRKSKVGGAWWAAVSWVAQSQTQLKRLSSSSRERKTNKAPY